MVEEEKDEQVIVIEDLDEESDESEEGEEQQTEEEPAKEESTDEEIEEEAKSIVLSASSLKDKKKLIIIGLSAVLLIIVSVFTFYVFFGKKEKPKNVEKKPVVHKQVKEKLKKEKKEQILKSKKYNPAVDAHFINALRLQEKGEYRAAIKELKQASVDLYLSYYSIGYMYLKLGELDKAKEYIIDKTKRYLLLSIENNPNYVLGYINLFRIYMANKEYKKANQVLEILKTKHISKREISLMRAYYDFLVNNRDSDVYKLADLYPKAPIINGLLGTMYLKEDNLNEAEYYLDKAIKPYVIGSLCYDKSLIYIAKGNYKSAMKCLPKSYYMDFGKIKCKNYLAFFVYLHEKKLKAAYDYFIMNKQYYPDCYKHFNIKPTLYYSISKKDYVERKGINRMLAAEILNMYLKPIKFNLGSASFGIKLGDLYESLGLPKKAKESYEDTALLAEAVLITQKALSLYAEGKLGSALLYYKKALKRANTNPILLYNVAIMYLKNHDVEKSMNIFKQLESSYPDFPLPYVGNFIVKQIDGKQKNAQQNLKKFLVKLKSISIDKVNKSMADMGVFAYFILDNRIDKKGYKRLTPQEKHLFLLIKAAINNDLEFLSVEKEFEDIINLNIDVTNYTTIMEYFNKKYKNSVFIKRTLADCYLFDKQYEKAYRAMFGIPQYNAEDYYKMGIAYYLDGYPEAADNFFTKSILKGVDLTNAYMAKAIMQAQKGDLKGVVYYLKIMLKKDLAWYNTYIFLSFDLELR